MNLTFCSHVFIPSRCYCINIIQHSNAYPSQICRLL